MTRNLVLIMTIPIEIFSTNDIIKVLWVFQIFPPNISKNIRDWCMKQFDQMLESVSRTFALSINNLPYELQKPVGLAYLLFRVSDSLEDHPDMEAARKIELLELWAEVLAEQTPAKVLTTSIMDLDSDDPEVYVAQHADELIHYLSTMPSELQEMMIIRVKRSTLGMARWQCQGPNVETVEELDDYMHQVAGRVGYLMTDIYAWYSPDIKDRKDELMPMSREIGLGLQTVNVIRGLRKDYERGWIFVPGTYLTQQGITRDQFFERDYEGQSINIVNKLAVKAKSHLDYGLAYISAFPRHQHRVRLASIWPLFFAIKTMAISRNNIDVIRNEVKITRQDVKTIIRKTTVMGWSERWLQAYYDKLNQSPVLRTIQ